MFHTYVARKGKNMVPHTPKTPAVPISNLRSESEASHLMTTVPRALNNRHPLGEIEVKSKEQPHMSLGNFSSANPPKGFAIHISPDPDPEAIVTQVTRLGENDNYELVLHIANYGNQTVSAEVWQL